MIWFRLKRLEQKLAQGEISEFTSFKYIAVYLIFFALADRLPDTQEFSSLTWEIGDFTIGMAISLIGTYTAFSINAKGDNIDFLKRFLCLSFVNGLRFVIFLLFLELIFKIFMYVIPLDLWHIFNDLVTGEIPKLLYSVIISLVFYLLVIKSFRRVNGVLEKSLGEVLEN